MPWHILKFYFALLLFATTPAISQARWRRRVCSSTYDNICLITDNRTVSRPLVLRWSGSIQFVGVHWQCTIRPASYESVRIDIGASGTISLLNGSLLHCATIALEARKVEISDSSEVSANGTSFAAEPLTSAEAASVSRWSAPPYRGASHGGLGGTVVGCVGDELQLLQRLPLVYGDPIAPWRFGRAAGVAAGRGLGGGRIRLIAAGALVLNGTLSAAGAGPEDADDDGRQAAGSGGSIWVSCHSFRQPAAASAAGAVASVGAGAVDFVDELGVAEGAPSPQSGRIVALGGCCARCLCGGGGRVLLEIVEGADPRHVLVAGGCWRASEASGGECRCGSAGTWALRQLSVGKRRGRLVGKKPGLGPRRWLPRWLRDRRLLRIQHLPPQPGTATTVHVDNSHAASLAGVKLWHPTPLSGFDPPVALQLHDAVVVPIEEKPSWTLSGLRLRSDQIGSALRHLTSEPLTLNFTESNEGVELAFSSTLEAHELHIIGAHHVTLRQNAAVEASFASISANEDIDSHQGALGQGEGAFELHAKRVMLGGGRLHSARVFVQEELRVARGSRLRSSHRRCDQLPSPLTDLCEGLLAGPAQAWGSNRSARAENVTFDVVLAARNGSILVEEEAELHAAAVLLCAAGNASVRGLVSARGLGCPPNRGESAGAAPEASDPAPPPPRLPRGAAGAGDAHASGCGGGGGAHSGSGGDGVRSRSRTPCVGTGGQKYDGWWASETSGTAKPSRLPTWSASGGGGSSAGAGGGIVWLHAVALELPSNGTSLSASGDDAAFWADGGTEGGGGGAGGSIIINVSLVVGAGVIEAAGGRGGGCIGGGGGGGAIGSGGPEAASAWAAFAGHVTVDGGLSDPSPGCSRGLGLPGGVGELLQLGVCRPGEAGIFCAPCPPGSYNPPRGPENLTAEYRICLPCKNKPMNANYTVAGWLNESCPYACPGGFPPVKVNPNCDDPWTYYFAFFGGVWGVASAILAITSLFGVSLSATHLQRLRRLQWLRKQRQAKGQFHGFDDEVLLLFESVRGRHPLADLGPAQATAGGSRRWLSRLLCPRLVGSRQEQKRLFSTGDLPYHAARIYLLGENSPHDPWRLSRWPPDELSDLIDSKRWEVFAAEVSCLCTEGMRLQSIAEGVLRWLYLPLAEYLRWRLRLFRAADVAARVWSWSEDSSPDQAFWRLSRDSSSRFALKFGTDWQLTLAFVDVLDYAKSLQDWVVKPQLPMAITAAGDGQYTAPYHLDYSDPFVQSAAQYLGRRTWHQVLLAFNILARLLPPNPTEQDIRLLRKSMARVSAHILQQTDLECHAVIFAARVQPTTQPRQPEPMHARGYVYHHSRQASWETMLPRPGMVVGSDGGSPKGGQTPTGQQPASGEVVWSHRPALILTQRKAKESTTRHRVTISEGATARRQSAESSRIQRIIHLGPSGLVSPAECLVRESPAVGYGPPPGIIEMSLEDQEMGSSLDLGPMRTSDIEWHLLQHHHTSAASVSSHLSSAGSSPPGSPPATRARRFWRSPTAGMERRHLRQLLAQLRQPRQFLAQLVLVCWSWCGAIGRRIEAALHCVVVPGNVVYGIYLRKLRDVRPLSGVGRQSGLYLRHRKPRGSQATTLLCLLLSLLAGALAFIAQSAVLFRLGPRHGAFFASLLWPPFADILALVFGVLFVCGAADGTVVCLFVVASNCNTALALVSRILATDTVRSIGLFYVLAEYAIVFSVKVAICRLVNLMIAYADADPSLLEPCGNEADHEWVREYVLFDRATSSIFTRLSSNEDVPDISVGDSSRPPAGAGPVFPCQNDADPPRQMSAGSFSDGWTPLLHPYDTNSPPSPEHAPE